MDNYVPKKTGNALFNGATKQEAALKKLRVKQHVDLCRRRVAYYEWKQSMLQMTMEDFNIYLKRIEKCNVCDHAIIF